MVMNKFEKIMQRNLTKQLKDAGVSDRNVTKALANMKKQRGLLGGFQSDHVKKGNKIDFYQNMFNRPGGDIMLQRLQDEKNWFYLPATAPSSGNSVFDVHLGKSKGSKFEFGKPQDQVIDSSRGYVIKAWKPYKEYDRDLTDDLKKKYKKAAERWQEHNIIKKTKREHPLVVEEEAIEQPAVAILGPIKTAPTQLTEAQALEQEQIAAEFDAQPIQQSQPVELTPPKPVQVLDIPQEVEEEKIVEEQLIEKDIVDEDIVEEEFKQEAVKESDFVQDIDIEDLEQD